MLRKELFIICIPLLTFYLDFDKRNLLSNFVVFPILHPFCIFTAERIFIIYICLTNNFHLRPQALQMFLPNFVYIFLCV